MRSNTFYPTLTKAVLTKAALTKAAQGLGRGKVIPWPPTASTMSTLVVPTEEAPAGD